MTAKPKPSEGGIELFLFDATEDPAKILEALLAGRGVDEEIFPEWVANSPFVIKRERLRVVVSKREGVDYPLLRLHGQSKRNARRMLPIPELETSEQREADAHNMLEHIKLSKALAGRQSGAARQQIPKLVRRIATEHGLLGTRGAAAKVQALLFECFGIRRSRCQIARDLA